MSKARHFLIVGAGLAGVTAAARLNQQGMRVTLIDKARAVGGRMATKRWGSLRVDTGAQFFTVTDPQLSVWVQSRLAEGDLFEWSTGFATLKGGKLFEPDSQRPHYACRSGMSSVAKWLAGGAELYLGQAVVAIQRKNSEFTVFLQDGTEIMGTDLILNLPPRQLVALAQQVLSKTALTKIETIEFDPCFALYGALARDLDVKWKGLELADHPVFSWIARDHTRRAAGAPASLVLHTRADWSKEHIEDDPAQIAALAETALRELNRYGIQSPELSTPLQVHRWRYARPRQICDLPLWDPELRVGICGDWTRAGRVEGAWISGLALLTNSPSILTTGAV